jgi:hypothetical protein
LNVCTLPLAEAQVWPIMRGDFGSSRDNLVELGPSPSGLDVEIELETEAHAISPAP